MAPKQTPPEAKKMTGLPVLVASIVDVGRLLREATAVDEAIAQSDIRKEAAQLPRLSQLMDQTLAMNKLDLLQATDRQILLEYLAYVKQNAPVIHISFSADPSTSFLEKLVAWMRREIHPILLLTIGLQPNIGAGCVLRSTNKYFDMSLKQDFANKRALLKDALSMSLEEATAPVEPGVTAAPAASVLALPAMPAVPVEAVA